MDFSKSGIEGEPVIRASIDAGADVVSFSGDKLLGGPQAGLIVGRSPIIERMRSHPLYRALRADKFRLVALEATLEAYLRGVSEGEVPVHRLISMSAAEIKERVERLIDRLRAGKLSKSVNLETMAGESAVGGGSAPTSRLTTVLISVTHDSLTPNQIEEALRRSSPPERSPAISRPSTSIRRFRASPRAAPATPARRRGSCAGTSPPARSRRSQCRPC